MKPIRAGDLGMVDIDDLGNQPGTAFIRLGCNRGKVEFSAVIALVRWELSIPKAMSALRIPIQEDSSSSIKVTSEGISRGPRYRGFGESVNRYQVEEWLVFRHWQQGIPSLTSGNMDCRVRMCRCIYLHSCRPQRSSPQQSSHCLHPSHRLETSMRGLIS